MPVAVLSSLLLCRCQASWAAKVRTLENLIVFQPATQTSISLTASFWRRYSGTRMIRGPLRLCSAYFPRAESYQSIASLWSGAWERSIASRNKNQNLDSRSSAHDYFSRRVTCLLKRLHPTIQLHLINCTSNFANARAGLQTHFQQMST